MRQICGLVVAVLAWPASAQGQQGPAIPRATFDHFATSTSTERPERSQTLILRKGQPFLVVIERTCEGQFDYAIRGILKEPGRPQGQAGRVLGTRKPLADKSIGPTPHDDRYGGYIIDVVKKEGAEGCAVDETEVELVTAQYFVTVTTDEWDYSISGGFAFSAPGSRKFALVPKTGSDTVKVVVRDEHNEGDAIASAGAFVHLFRSAGFFNRVAPTFGISVETDSKVAYFGGLGWRLGRVATLIGGVSLNQLAVLPAGVAVGTETENADLLANLPTESKLRFMVGISFAFLPGGNAIGKPFAGEQNQPGEGR